MAAPGLRTGVAPGFVRELQPNELAPPHQPHPHEEIHAQRVGPVDGL